MYNSQKSINNEKLRKRLGQYFTREEVVELLIVLSEVGKNAIIIDPMVGIGNILVSLLKNGYKKENIFGIEIDPSAGNICKKRVGNENIILGDAFRKNIHSDRLFKPNGWDLVITNPPYVRYQLLSKDLSLELELPTASEIRSNLIDTIDQFSHLDEVDKKLLKILAESYSGLSDIAVPSWILCASMVKTGGKLAMVVPDTWLNREYAVIIQYLLLKWFDIEYIVEDVNSKWFTDAQVKTNLLIAKKRSRRSSICEVSNIRYNYIKVYSNVDPREVVSEILEEDIDLKENLKLKLLLDGSKYTTHTESMNNMVSNVLSYYANTKWFQEMEGSKIDNGFIPQNIPSDIIAHLDVADRKFTTTTLEYLGISVGQGLRTGANKFFYLTLYRKESDSDEEYLKTDNHFGNTVLKVPVELTRVVLRKQNDLPNQLVINSNDIEGRLLYIQNAIAPHDLKKANNNLISNYKVLEKELGEHIYIAENSPVNNKDPDKLIPNLSAVKPNVRIDRKNGEETQRFWYMLPELTKRHIPEFCIPRVNNESPRVYMLLNQNVVVDANFSTIWFDAVNYQNKYAFFAFFNSTWVKACLESISTVMGGGALKVEAAHIRKVPIPELERSDYRDLNQYGQILSKLKNQKEIRNIIRQIDTIILKRLLKCNSVDNEVLKLEMFVESKIKQRKNN